MKRRVNFTLTSPEAKEVKLSGSFNDWNPENQPLKRNRNGVWETCLVLEPGTYQYRFLVDGQWQDDPHADDHVPNEYGTQNSVRIVALTIMVVDDEESVRVLIEEELEESGCKVILASSGFDALEKIKETIPDLIILDIKISGMDGIELLERIQEQSMDIPVILYTAYVEYKQNLVTWASNAYIVKPPYIEGLISKIKKLL